MLVQLIYLWILIIFIVHIAQMYGDDIVPITQEDKNSLKDLWILDPTCSFYICLNKDDLILIRNVMKDLLL